MSKIKIDSEIIEFEGTIESFFIGRGMNPDSFLFLINGRPVPMDTVPESSQTVLAVRVASGG